MLQRQVEPRQYTSKDYAKLCADLGVILSMGAIGSSADNALAESFNATLKRQTLHGAARSATTTTPDSPCFKWITHYDTVAALLLRHLSPVS